MAVSLEILKQNFIFGENVELYFPNFSTLVNNKCQTLAGITTEIMRDIAVMKFMKSTLYRDYFLPHQYLISGTS